MERRKEDPGGSHHQACAWRRLPLASRHDMPTEISGERHADSVIVERRADAAWVTLNRPAAMNALSRSLVNELRAAVRTLRSEHWVRAFVLTGAGDKAFCAGADLKERRTMSLDDTRTFLTDL